jgi:hypothetical protein
MIETRSFVALLGAVALFWSYRRWREAVQLAVVLLVFEGAMRKWLFPGAQDLVYFGKEVVLLGAYAGFLQDRRRPKVHVPRFLASLLATCAVLGALQIFNPRSPNLLVGLLGFKAYFFYMPLAWILPAVFTSPTQLYERLRLYLLLALPIGLLAAAQFLSPADSPLNAYARSGGAGGISTFGSSTHVRVTATFSYITGYTSYLLVTVILVLALLARNRWLLRGNLALYGCLAAALVGMFTTGSRGPLLMITLLFPVYLWLSLARERQRDAMLGRILLGLSLVAALVNQVGADAIGAFYGRAAGSEDLVGRVLNPFVQPFNLFYPSGFLGYGIGATHQTAEAVTRGIEPYSWLEGNRVEDEPGRVMLELGPFGFFFIYLVRVHLVLKSLEQVFRLRTPFGRALATSCALFFLAHLPGGVVFNVTADVYYWYFVGLLLCAQRLESAASTNEEPQRIKLAPPLWSAQGIPRG